MLSCGGWQMSTEQRSCAPGVPHRTYLSPKAAARLPQPLCLSRLPDMQVCTAGAAGEPAAEQQLPPLFVGFCPSMSRHVHSPPLGCLLGAFRTPNTVSGRPQPSKPALFASFPCLPHMLRWLIMAVVHSAGGTVRSRTRRAPTARRHQARGSSRTPPCPPDRARDRDFTRFGGFRECRVCAR